MDNLGSNRWFCWLKWILTLIHIRALAVSQSMLAIQGNHRESIKMLLSVYEHHKVLAAAHMFLGNWNLRIDMPMKNSSPLSEVGKS